jgi:hypothetical protein
MAFAHHHNLLGTSLLSRHLLLLLLFPLKWDVQRLVHHEINLLLIKRAKLL